MTRSQRMKVVQNHQQDKANKAAQVAVNSRNVLDVQHERLNQLAAYRNEYWQKFSASGGMNTARLQDFRQFITRLDGAIEQQRQVVERAEMECRERQDEWLHERTREKVIGTAVEKIAKQEHVAKEKHEQKMQDEFSQKLHTYQRRG